MRIVFDSNVLLSGMFTRGLCEQLLDECFASSDRILVSSDHILHEFESRAVRKFRVPPPEAKSAAALLRSHFEMVVPGPIAGNICRDPDDLPVLGTATAGNVEFLVSGDKDLLVIERIEKVRILSPRQFYDLLR